MAHVRLSVGIFIVFSILIVGYWQVSVLHKRTRKLAQPRPEWARTIKPFYKDSAENDSALPVLPRNQLATAVPKPAQPDEKLEAGPGTGDCRSAHPLLVCERDKFYGFRTAETIQMRAATDRDFLKNKILRDLGKHPSCALVGSSGNILRYEFGEEIDEHDLVIRTNPPPTTVLRKYEKYVGSRSGDVLVFGPSAAVGLCSKFNRNQSYLLATIPGPLTLQRKANIDFIRDCWKSYGQKVYLINGEFSMKAGELCNYVRKECKTTYKRKDVTGGLTALLFTMHICRNVDIYGYGINEAELFEFHKNITVKKFYSMPTRHDWTSEARLLDYLTSNSDAPKKFMLPGYDHSPKVRRRGASYDVPGATRCLPKNI